VTVDTADRELKTSARRARLALGGGFARGALSAARHDVEVLRLVGREERGEESRGKLMEMGTSIRT
jgi:hypothetical protein